MKKIRIKPFNLLVVFFVIGTFFPIRVYGRSQEYPVLKNLRCEMLTNPLGIDAIHPRLSWEILGKQRDLTQTAYQVLVASSRKKLSENKGDLWNSGKIYTDHSVNVRYKGKPLNSQDMCFWKVRIWTRHEESNWSKLAYWSMGLLHKSDWKAKWIGLNRTFSWDSAHTKFSRLSARYFRKQFDLSSSIKKATIYIVGLGYYQLFINGKRIGNQVLSPSPTDYTKAVLYNTFNVTNQLKRGENAIGAVLGNGYFFTMRQNYKTYKIRNFGYPKMLLQLEVQYKDGVRKVITSNGSWKVTANGPIRTDNIYDGESYDATKEMPGWDEVGFNDQNWLKAQLVKSPGGKIKAQMNANERVMATVHPKSIHYLRPGVYIMDMGQNMAGWIKMKVKGKKGRKVTLRFGETLQANGELSTINFRDAKATYVYTLNGKGEETFAPSFVYQGFRYVEITNYPGKPKLKDFAGQVVYDGIATTGSFKTSNPLINHIYKNAFWSVRSNYKGMPVDCPQRNERMPWLGDRAVSSYGESFIFDNENLYAKWLNDIQESQTKQGVIPDVDPAFWKYYTDDITWPSTYFLVAQMLYRQFDDKQPILRHYASMKKWIFHIRDKYMKNYLIPKDKYGDWCMPPAHLRLIHAVDPSLITSGELIATAYYYHMLRLMTHFAKIVDKPQDSREFSALSDKIKTAFNKKFLNKKTFQYSNNTVTADELPLFFGMVPPGEQRKVFENIVESIENRYQDHIITGVIGTQWLMRTLTNYGRADLAYKIVTQKTYPGWGYMVEHGATTIWELWNGNKANQEMSSRNHVMLLGDLIVWFYEDLAGIKSDPDHPGFKQIDMKPQMITGLDSVSASYHSIRGLIKSQWKRRGHHFYWNITIPGNTDAIIYIPAHTEKEVMIKGQKANHVRGISFLRMESNRAVYKVGSGNYSFESEF